MKARTWRILAVAAVALVAAGAVALPVSARLIRVGGATALAPLTGSARIQAVRAKMDARVTIAERLTAAARLKAEGKTIGTRLPASGVGPMIQAIGAPSPGGTPNYFGPEPNWLNTPQLRKFVDGLPGLGAANANNLGQYIPVAVPDTTTYPGTDYYEIELGQYTEQMHSDLKPTTLRGYRQTNTTDPTVSKFNYLGPLIVAHKGRPVRVKFTNSLPTGAGGNLFLPVDSTIMGAGMGPLGMKTTSGYPMDYTQNRATLHLHGGHTVWISDGNQNQWITPAGEKTDYPRGVSVHNVPDMPNPGPGSQTFYYSNDQSARLLFYHDHAFGITRLNVFAGEAGGYVLRDQTEDSLVAAGTIPSAEVPLIIQDKTWLPSAATVAANDPTWPFAVDSTKSNLWWPHVYMTNQDPNDPSFINPLGRWDYGPWMQPPWPTKKKPLTLANGTKVPNVPDLSATMEYFADTPLVNGAAYPSLTVDPKAYRFRILNAANDRMWNLQLWQADPSYAQGTPGYGTEVKTLPFAGGGWPAGWPTPDARPGGIPDPSLAGPDMIQIGTEAGFLPAPVTWTNTPMGWDRDTRSATYGNMKEHNLLLAPAERADVIVDFSKFAGKTLILYSDAPAPAPAADPRVDYYTGDPDYTSVGGAPSTQPGMGPNTRTIMQIKVAAKTPAPAFDTAGLDAAFASTATQQGAFAKSQNEPIVPQDGYDSAYNAAFPSDGHAYATALDTGMTFTPIGGAAPVTKSFKKKTIIGVFSNTDGRMSVRLGVELPFVNNQTPTTIDYTVQDPPTELLKDSVAPIGAAGDGTQLWRITNNDVDTHPVHFHLFDVQLVDRIDAVGVVKPPEPNELGWKDTVRMNPLEDVIVALRPTAATIPWGVPDSKHALDVTMPIGSTLGFRNISPTGKPVKITNQVVNFGWEYVWHCHILSHEEMDMMRPISFTVAHTTPAVPVVSRQVTTGMVKLTWNDATPFDYATGTPASTLNSARNEIGFRIQRAPVSSRRVVGAYRTVGQALANTTTFTDASATAGKTYLYRVVAYNEGGSATSRAVKAKL